MQWKFINRVLKTGQQAPRWISTFKKTVYIISFLALFFIIIQSGLRWRLPFLLTVFVAILDYVVLVLYLADAGLNFYLTFPKRNYFRKYWLDVIVFIPLTLTIATPRAGIGFIVARHIIILAQTFTRTRKFSNLLHNVRLNTTQMVALSFLGTIFVGTIFLTFPSATADGLGTTFIDALFTSTSATCVTGLIVKDTPTYFTTFGQIIILALIQLGGLGIRMYSAFFALLFGKFSLGQRQIVQDMMDEERNVLTMITYIFKMTIFVELAGAIVLFLRWIFHFHDLGQAVYYSIFHSISAFCNAGFSLFSDSLEGFVNDPVINIVIMALIIIGGIGFIVIYETTHLFRHARRRLSTHTRLVLVVSMILVISAFLAIFFIEFDGALLDLPLIGKVWAALFQAVTPRTAGFNTIPIASCSTITITLIILLMFIGASPGSTGGGVKTSTFAILILSLKSIFSGKENVQVFKRTIVSSIIYKAVALVVASFLLVFTVFIALLAVEDKPFLPLLFETISAFGTVGLSTGITPDLTPTGKMFIILLMYAGRIGPLTLGLALMRSARHDRIQYPQAKVLIG
jgi:trk system potassium uptake protein TrkH